MSNNGKKKHVIKFMHHLNHSNTDIHTYNNDDNNNYFYADMDVMNWSYDSTDQKRKQIADSCVHIKNSGMYSIIFIHYLQCKKLPRCYFITERKTFEFVYMIVIVFMS